MKHQPYPDELNATLDACSGWLFFFFWCAVACWLAGVVSSLWLAVAPVVIAYLVLFAAVHFRTTVRSLLRVPARLLSRLIRFRETGMDVRFKMLVHAVATVTAFSVVTTTPLLAAYGLAAWLSPPTWVCVLLALAAVTAAPLLSMRVMDRIDEFYKQW